MGEIENREKEDDDDVVDLRKLAKIEREKKDLLASLAGADFSKKKQK